MQLKRLSMGNWTTVQADNMVEGSPLCWTLKGPGHTVAILRYSPLRLHEAFRIFSVARLLW